MEMGNYRLKVPAVDLQSLAGAITDLQIAEDMLQHCIESDIEIHDTCEELEEACWTTAVIRYERSFSCRSWPSKEIVIDKLSATQLETHHFFRFLRDKMFGHALGVGEDFEITAAVYPGSSGKLEIVGVGPRPRRISSPGSDLAKEFSELVTFVRQLVEQAYERMKAQLLRDLRGKAITEMVKGLPVIQTDLPWGKDDRSFRRYLDAATRSSKR
jgi:hypothetical protein